ncbi:MAG: hypothetical protein PF574_05065 [Candidatus Delongbacteria bacterium]|jgi:hypothetical protein|nr:hypothetical protein [Candidatus Delongbacteria bacterium]
MPVKIQITDEQKVLLRKIANIIASKGMTTPTIFFLETMQPLNYIGSQFMAYLEPFLTFVIPRDAYNDIQKILEQRKGIDYFLSILEDEEFEKQKHDKQIRQDIKNLKKMEKVALQEKKKLKKKLKKQKEEK